MKLDASQATKPNRDGREARKPSATQQNTFWLSFRGVEEKGHPEKLHPRQGNRHCVNIDFKKLDAKAKEGSGC